MTIPGTPDTDIRLFTTGTLVRTGDVFFNTDDYTFALHGMVSKVDLTYQIGVADKQKYWPDFDISHWNELMYQRQYQAQHDGQTPPPTGSTNTWDIFKDQIANNPLEAPLQSLDRTVGQVFSSSGIQTILIAGIIIFGLHMMSESRK